MPKTYFNPKTNEWIPEHDFFMENVQAAEDFQVRNLDFENKPEESYKALGEHIRKMESMAFAIKTQVGRHYAAYRAYEEKAGINRYDREVGPANKSNKSAKPKDDNSPLSSLAKKVKGFIDAEDQEEDIVERDSYIVSLLSGKKHTEDEVRLAIKEVRER